MPNPGLDYEWYISHIISTISPLSNLPFTDLAVLLTGVGRVQGGEKYQSAFYVYEELASNPSTSASLSVVGQAIAELHLGRFPEAEAALTTAIEKYPEDAQLIANTIVLNVLTGKDTTALTSYVPYIFFCYPKKGKKKGPWISMLIEERLAGWSRCSHHMRF